MLARSRTPLPCLFVFVFAFGLAAGLDADARGDDASVPTARHPIVPGFERFHTGGAGGGEAADPVRGGLILLGELNCTSCHAADAPAGAQLLRKQAPILDRVGSRARPEYLRDFLADPHGVKPGTTMPDLLAAMPEGEKASAVEALVHLLAATGTVQESVPSSRAVAAGKKLYHQIGCVACHGRRDEPGPRLPASMPLGDLSRKYSVAGLAAFLQDPLRARPSGRMPALSLVRNEPNALASYLLRDLRAVVRPNLSYRSYEGDWQKLPDFDALEPKSSGKVAGFELGVARRNGGGVALRFEGVLRLEAAGEYTFHLTSDDGSKLWIDGKPVVDNDGIHPASTESDRVELTKGTHRLVVGVFDGGGEFELDVEYEGRGLPRQSVLGAVSLEEDGPEPDADVARPDEKAPARFVVDRDLAEKGRGLFARLGCASCHRLEPRDSGRPIASTLDSPPLAKLTPDARGCLSLDHAGGGLMYRLDDAQRAALVAALKAMAGGPLPSPSPREVVARTMTAFNCYACHARDGKGGVEEARQAFFETSQKEMGDEGRIPPNLDGVGAKLQDGYMRRYFDYGVKDRPYMLTRMPRFNATNLGPLIAAFAAADPLEPVPTPAFDDSPRRVKSVGRFLAGGEALGCIKCHNFKGVESEGVQAVDMAVMTRRLRHDWFHRYLINTQAYRPGTRMPTAWPDGRTLLPKVLGGDSRKQIEALWLFLADGRDADEPYGLGREPMPLVPDKEVILYRNFLKGAGPRGIGVGYPEHANLAFDANHLRLALIWQGPFIDASRHWAGRGSGFQAPLGGNILAFPTGPNLAFLSNPEEPWPAGPAKALGDAFRGYRLAPDGRPTFLYDVGPARVADYAEPVAGADPKAATLRRTLTVSGGPPDPNRTLWFRALAADKVEPLGDGRYKVDGEWTTRIVADAPPVLRKANGKTEILVPIRPDVGREARVIQEFNW